MNPRTIAEWVDRDLRPGGTGLVSEDLYGHHVEPGDSPVDILIASVERNYLEFDPSNQRFQDAVARTVGIDLSKEDGIARLAKLVRMSNQSPELKKELLDRLGGQDEEQDEYGGEGKWMVALKDGRVLEADLVARHRTRNGKPFLYLASDPGTIQIHTETMVDKPRPLEKRIWEPIKVRGSRIGGIRKYRTVRTVLLKNVASVRKVG